MHTTSEPRALTEAPAQEDTLSAPSASDGEHPAEQSADTLQLRPELLRRVAPKPVFVDASGRNRQRLRILVAALVIPIVAYVALLVSALVGGPAIPSALLPHFAAPVRHDVAPTHAKPSPHKSQSPRREIRATPTPSRLRATRARPSSSASPAPSASKTTQKGKPKPTASPSASATPHPTPSPTYPKLPGNRAG